MTKNSHTEQRPALVYRRATVVALVYDYLAGFVKGFVGLPIIGWRWLVVLFLYLFHPVVGRMWRGRILTVAGIRVRLGECDLTVLVNMFRDYNVRLLKQQLPQIEVVIDAGANIGAFAFLVKALCPNKKVIAFEPEPATFAFLQQQPFCRDVECRCEAIGAVAGDAELLPGTNSVTHQVNFAQRGPVNVVSLQSLCTAPALLKLDIEGAERSVLAAGIPDNLLCILMEWHFSDSPAPFFNRGILTEVHFTPYGQTTWSWVSQAADAVQLS